VRGLCLGLGLLVACALVHAQPAPPVLAKAWLLDPSGALTIAQVVEQPFNPYQGILSRGYPSGGALWIKLTIAAAPLDDSHDVLRIRPSWHDQIELHDPGDPLLGPRLSGDHIDWSFAENPALSLDFLVVRQSSVRDIYLRVQTAHTHLIEVELLSRAEAARQALTGQLVQLFYVALLVMVLYGSLSSRELKSDKVLVAFVLLQVSALMHAVLLFGMGRPLLGAWLSPWWIDRATTLSVLLYPLAGIHFHLKLLSEYGLSSRVMRSLWAYVPFSVLILILFAAGLTTSALKLNAWLILLFAVHVLVFVWTVQKPRPAAEESLLPFAYLKGFYTLFCSATLAGAIALLGIFDAHGFQLYAFFPHGFLSAVVMAMLLRSRAERRGRRTRLDLQIQTQRAQGERQRREEQSSFMAMLNHEIKTPLAIIRFVLSRSPAKAAGQRAVDDMVRLLDKCLLLEDLEDLDGRLASIRREALWLDDLVQVEIAKLGQELRFDLRQVQRTQVSADKLLCETMVSNLLENALKYAPQTSLIRLGLESVPGQGSPAVRLWVVNEIGQMGAPDCARVFDKYYRAPAARAISGSGLGLYIVRRLSNMHGGDIRCESSDTHIQFELFLPC